jgi:large repetitive protein
MRRTLTYVWSLLCLCFVSTTAMAQNGQYDVRFAIKSYDCVKDSVIIQVQVKSHDAAHTFRMGDANYRFDYDPRVIKNPSIVSQENYSNQFPANNFHYNAQTLQGSSAGLTLGTVSLNTIYGSGGNDAQLVPTTWTTVSCIRFKVQDPAQCINLIWHDNNRFPITGMNEVVLLGGGAYDIYDVAAGGIFGNFSQCIPTVCNNITALNDINTTLKNVPVSGNLLTNDVSTTAMTATTTPVIPALNGVVTITATGAYTYTPTAGFVGKDSAQYRVCNLGGQCDTAWLFVTVVDNPVAGVNSKPIAQNDNGLTYMDVPVTGNVLSNDIDPDNNTLTVNTTPITSPTNGTLVLNANGSYTYTPNNGFVGTDVFRYQVCDNGVPSKCDTASVTIDVLTQGSRGSGTNLPPSPMDDSYQTYKDVTLTGNLKLNDTDPNAGQTLTYTTTPVVAPAHGTVTITAAGTFIYVPTTGYTGPDQFIYQVCDNGVPILCANATATILVVNAPNEKPVVTVTPQIVGEDTTKVFCFPIADPNATDTHTVTACTPSTVGGTATAVVDNVAHTLCVTYKSALNYNGQDTACFIVCDNGVPSKCDTVKIPITVTPINDKPVVIVTPVVIKEDSIPTFCLPITDPDVGQTFTATPCTTGNGTTTATIVGNTVCITYTPNLNYNGLDTACVIVCDNGVPSKCDTVKVPIVITPVNDKPVIIPVTPQTTVEDSTIIICTTITDPDGGSPVFTPSVCGVQHGTATPSVIGNQLCITYTPTLNYNGPDTLCIVVCDNGVPSKCDTVKIPVTVTPVNDKPVVIVTPVVIKEDSIPTFCLPITDPDAGSVFSVTPCTTTNGTTTSTIVGNTVCITYTPRANYFGPDTACVIVCDNGVPSKCDTVKVPITVTPVNDKPVIPDATATTPNTTPTTVCLPITDADATDTHTYSSCGTPTMGTVSAVVNNVTHQVCITYTPNVGSVGTERLCIRICDSGTPTLCDTAELTINIGSTNDKPVAINDINSTLKNTPVSGNVKTNDSDPNNHTLTVNSTPVQGPTNGVLVLNPNGTYTYTPTTNFVGTETILYQVCDNGTPSLCDTARLVIEVRDVAPGGNQAPVATDDNTSTPAGQTIVIAVKANDYDPQNGTIGNPTLFGTPIGGTPTLNPDGTITFVPAPGFTGDAVFKYFVCDNGTPSLCDSATVTVNVYQNPNQGNVAPVAIDDTYPVLKDTPFSGTVATNDYDQNAGQVLSYAQITNPTQGTVTLLSNGQLSFTPTTGFVGVDSFKYKVCDNGMPSLCDTAVVIFNITAPIVPPTNVAPVAVDDNTTTVAGTPVTIPVKANDYDPNGGQTLTNPVIVGTPVGGTVVVNPDGTVTFTPNPGFTGPASFVYQICDNGTPVLCDNATVTVNVIPTPAFTNRPPVAGNDAATTPLNTPLNGSVATNDSDPDAGQTLSYTRITPPENGVVSINPTTGAFLYTPLAVFVGLDSFQYKICDNGSPSLCDTAWAFVTVAAPIGTPNVPPTAGDDNSSTTAGTPVTINVKANDFDLNPGTVLGTPVIIGTPVGGTPSVNGNGTVTFTPTPGFTGVATFKYQVCDNGIPSLCDTATVTIDVTPATNFVNIAPIAINDATTTPVSTPVSGTAKTNDSDINAGQTLTYATTPVNNPLHGSIVILADGSYTYTPTAGFIGLDSAQYRVCDNGTPTSLCATAWIIIDITAPGVNNNLPPVVTKDNAATTVGVPVTINVKANDYDPNTGQTLGLPTIVTPSPNGTATVNPDGTITFTPTPGFTGTTTFTYQVCDNGFAPACNSAVVTVVVGATPPSPNINLAPVASDDVFQTLKNTTVTGTTAANDLDPNAGQSLSYGLLTNTTNGIVSLNANGTYSYTPTAGFTGTDQFTYKICDNGLPSLCDTATVYFTIYDFPCVSMNLKVLLEGSLRNGPSAGVMRTTLNERGLLPGQTPIGQFAAATPVGHPFSGAPWNLVDTTGQTMTTYDPNVTDWVLVSLRTSNLVATNVLRVPALLMKDGTVRFINPCFAIANGNYYIVIEHRNHMGAMSPSAVAVTNGVLNFDFTTGNSLASLNVNDPPAFGQKLVGTAWAMYAGDGRKNTTVTNYDINFNDSVLWKAESGIFDQYRYSDFDMNADVNFNDQVLWKLNNGRYSVVPH